MKNTPTTNRLCIRAFNDDDRSVALAVTVTGRLSTPVTSLAGVVVEHSGDDIFDVVCEGSWSEGTVTEIRIVAPDDGVDVDITEALLEILAGRTGAIDLRGVLTVDRDAVEFDDAVRDDGNDVDEDGPHPEDAEPDPEARVNCGPAPVRWRLTSEEAAAPTTIAALALRKGPLPDYFVLVPGTEAGAGVLNARCVGTDGVAEYDEDGDEPGDDEEGEQIANPVTILAANEDGSDGVVWILEYEGRHYGCQSEGSWQEEYTWSPVLAAVPTPAVKVTLG